MNTYNKPLPELEGMHGEFYSFCKKEELRFQKCGDCSTWRHVPREVCPQCGSWNWQWALSSGKGTVFTWTTITRALHPAFKDDCPLAGVVVELEEGVRLLSHVIDCAPEDLKVGMPVEVIFEKTTEEISLPKFKLA